MELLKAIAEKPQVDDAFLHVEYDEKKMWDFSEVIATKFGYDWERGRQDKAAHPFTANFSINDVRITTRFESDNPSYYALQHHARDRARALRSGQQPGV